MDLPVVRHALCLDPRERRCALRALLRPGAFPGARQRFEQEFARYLAVGQVFGLASARSALAVILKALDLPPGARVVLPAYTFFTLPLVVRSLGLTPVFAPVDPGEHAIDPDRLDPLLADAAALVLIHPFGQLARVERIDALCRRAGVVLIEDASQSTGAARGGRRAGAFGRASCFSLVWGKNLQTFGGGLVATSDVGLAARIHRLLEDAKEPDDAEIRARFLQGLLVFGLTHRVGYATLVHPVFRALSALDRDRLDRLFREPRRPVDPHAPPVLLSGAQGRLGCLGLERLESRNAIRRRHAGALLRGLAGLDGLGLPGFDRVAVNTWNSFAVGVADARATAQELLRRGVDTRRDYMEWQVGGNPAAGEVLYLPNHPGLTARDLHRVVIAVRALFRSRGSDQPVSIR